MLPTVWIVLLIFTLMLFLPLGRSLALSISSATNLTLIAANVGAKGESSAGLNWVADSHTRVLALEDGVIDQSEREATMSTERTVGKMIAETTPDSLRTIEEHLPAVCYADRLKPLPGTKSEELLHNPNRGFRLELNMDIATGNLLESVMDARQYALTQIKYYEDEAPQLAQVYIYLTQYSAKDLDDRALINLQDYFAFFRKQNMQILLRFAYEYQETGPKIGPTTEQMLRHIEQLRDIVAQNNDIIHVIQAGFIGMWGEWHNAKYEHDKRQVLEAIIDMTPPDKVVQVRLASYKDVLRKDDLRRDRVSYHDDYLVGVDHAWSTALPASPLYAMYITDCRNMLVDGEMPWGKDKYFNNGVIDGVGVAKRLMNHYFSTMSIVHNYKESGPFITHNMQEWKKIIVDAAFLDDNEFRYAPAWLKDSDGNPITRSLFEYIRDYLGYYIEAHNAKADVSGNQVEVSLELTNYGFSAPHGMSKLEVVITDEQGSVICAKPVCHMADLQPGKVVSVSTTLTVCELQRGYIVGIRFANQGGVTAKLANDTEYVNGVNVVFVL
jgi:hypothetical protein